MKTKISQLISIVLILCLPTLVIAQTLDEIINKHIEAHGGAEKWKSVDALKISGTFTAFSLENEYSSYKTSSGYYYADLNLGEMPVVEAFDGNSGWTIDPWQEIYYARKLNTAELNVFYQKAEFFTPFYNYEEKGHTVEYVGKDTIEGLEVFELKLTRSNGNLETWYLNSQTYLEYICKSNWVDFGRSMPAESFFDDFREVDGLILPFFVERTFWQRDRILQIENVEINPEIDPAIFEMPRRDEMKQLEFMVGDWDVVVEAWTQRGTWYPFGNTTSSISFVSPNKLQENITYDWMLLVAKTINYTFSESTGNYRISVYDDLATSLNFFEGNFTDTSFVFDDTSVRINDKIQEAEGNIQYSIYNMDENGFVLEIKRSGDEGQNWGSRSRFTYTRKEQ